MTRPVSQLGVFRAGLWVRWFLIAMIPVQVYLAQGRTESAVTVVAVVVAVGYTLVLTLNARRALAYLDSTLWFAAADMAVGLALYATGRYTQWVFFLFSATSFLMVAVRGRVREGVAAAVVWNALATSVQYASGVPASQVYGIMAVEDLFNLSIVSAMWAYASSLVLKLNGAYDMVSAGADELARANVRLDEKEKVILGLMDAGDAIVREGDLSTILGTVVGALSGVGFGPCRIWTVEEGVFRSVFPPGHLVPDVANVKGSPLGVAVERGRPVSIPPGGGGSAPGLDPSKLSLAMPVLANEERLGVLAIESVSGEPFDEVDIEILTLFADQIALAVQHIRLYQRTRERAVAGERSRITREIHDTVVQKVYGANLIAESLRTSAVTPQAAARIASLHETIEASLKDLRIAILNWDCLEWDVGLSDAIERYAAEISALTGIAVSVMLRGEFGRCHATSASAALRVLQTALSNVWHHAHAKTVHVDVTCDRSGLMLAVRDDGRGFDFSDVDVLPAGGVAHMRDLGQRQGGWVEVVSAPGDGTQVRFWAPC